MFVLLIVFMVFAALVSIFAIAVVVCDLVQERKNKAASGDAADTDPESGPSA